MTDGRKIGPAALAILPVRQPPPLHDRSGGYLCPDLRNCRADDGAWAPAVVRSTDVHLETLTAP